MMRITWRLLVNVVIFIDTILRQALIRRLERWLQSLIHDRRIGLVILYGVRMG